MKRFVFDCDDTLLNWQKGFAAFLSDRGIETAPEGPQTWSLAEWIGCSNDAAASWVRRFNVSPEFRRLWPMEGAFEILWALKEAGHRVSVLTCCGDQKTIADARKANLKTIFGRGKNVPYERVTCLPLGALKTEYVKFEASFGNVVVVEDDFGHARAAAAIAAVFCLRRSHNRQDEIQNPGSGVTWINSLFDLHRYI